MAASIVWAGVVTATVGAWLGLVAHGFGAAQVLVVLIIGAAGVAFFVSLQPAKNLSRRRVGWVEITDEAIRVHALYYRLVRTDVAITIPLDSVTDVRVDDEVSRQAPGLMLRTRPVGHFTPHAIRGGFVPLSDRAWTVFYATRRGMPTVVIDYRGLDFQRAVVESDQPKALVEAISEAVSRHRHAAPGS